MVAVRPDPTKIYPRYLLAVLRSRVVRDRIDGMHVGTLIPHFKKGDFGKLMIPVPDCQQQKEIGDFYLLLSSKIEINKLLVERSLALLRSFVDRALAKEERNVAVADLGAYVNGGPYTKGASGSGRMVIRIAELNTGPGPSTVYSDIGVPQDRTARAGDILMSWSGSLGVYRWFRDEAIVNQHIFKVLPKDGYPAWLVFDRLDAIMPAFQRIAKDKATTMGHIQRGHLETTQVAVPSPPVIKELDFRVTPLWDRLLLAERESLKLASLRDTLLPELLSGRVRIAEVLGAIA